MCIIVLFIKNNTNGNFKNAPRVAPAAPAPVPAPVAPAPAQVRKLQHEWWVDLRPPSDGRGEGMCASIRVSLTWHCDLLG